MPDRRRVVVLGGSGHFGRRIAARLRDDGRFEVIAAGRNRSRLERAAASIGIGALVLDRDDPAFPARLQHARPWALVDAAGPFQGRDHAVPDA